MKQFRSMANAAAPRVLGCALFLASFASLAQADTWDKRTTVSFSGQVEVPGTVLEPGKYIFRLVDSASNRHIVQISNERQDHVYATVLAIPNYRLQPRGKSVFTFYEARAGKPEPLRAWFYPGDNYGQEFAYPKERAVELAQNVDTAPAALPTPAAETPAPQPAVVDEDKDDTVKMDEPAPTPTTDTDSAETGQTALKDESAMASDLATDDTADEPQTPAPADSPSPAMPATASQLGLILLFGAGSIIGATALRARNKHVN